MIKLDKGVIYSFGESFGPFKCECQDQETGEYCLCDSWSIFVTNKDLECFDHTNYDEIKYEVLNSNLGLSLCDGHLNWMLKNER